MKLMIQMNYKTSTTWMTINFMNENLMVDEIDHMGKIMSHG
jgi:hypothetical protein